jgi:uncharacterized protein YqeY
MTIASDLAAELKDAMLKKDARRRDVIRQVQTEITIARSEPGYDESKDDEVAQRVIESYSKRMQKSIAEYESYGERGADMADKLKFEVEYLSRWMPQKLDEVATRALIEAKIAELGVEGDEKAAGRVTGMIMKDHKDDVDGALVNRLVRESLAR